MRWLRRVGRRRSRGAAGSGASIDALIARSSLGSPEAVKLRESVPREVVERVLRRADELGPLEVDVVVSPPTVPPDMPPVVPPSVSLGTPLGVEVPRPTPGGLRLVPGIPRPAKRK